MPCDEAERRETAVTIQATAFDVEVSTGVVTWKQVFELLHDLPALLPVSDAARWNAEAVATSLLSRLAKNGSVFAGPAGCVSDTSANQPSTCTLASLWGISSDERADQSSVRLRGFGFSGVLGDPSAASPLFDSAPSQQETFWRSVVTDAEELRVHPLDAVDLSNHFYLGDYTRDGSYPIRSGGADGSSDIAGQRSGGGEGGRGGTGQQERGGQGGDHRGLLGGVVEGDEEEDGGFVGVHHPHDVGAGGAAVPDSLGPRNPPGAQGVDADSVGSWSDRSDDDEEEEGRRRGGGARRWRRPRDGTVVTAGGGGVLVIASSDEEEEGEEEEGREEEFEHILGVYDDDDDDDDDQDDYEVYMYQERDDESEILVTAENDYGLEEGEEDGARSEDENDEECFLNSLHGVVANSTTAEAEASNLRASPPPARNNEESRAHVDSASQGNDLSFSFQGRQLSESCPDVPADATEGSLSAGCQEQQSLLIQPWQGDGRSAGNPPGMHVRRLVRPSSPLLVAREEAILNEPSSPPGNVRTRGERDAGETANAVVFSPASSGSDFVFYFYTSSRQGWGRLAPQRAARRSFSAGHAGSPAPRHRPLSSRGRRRTDEEEQRLGARYSCDSGDSFECSSGSSDDNLQEEDTLSDGVEVTIARHFGGRRRNERDERLPSHFRFSGDSRRWRNRNVCGAGSLHEPRSQTSRLCDGTSTSLSRLDTGARPYSIPAAYGSHGSSELNWLCLSFGQRSSSCELGDSSFFTFPSNTCCSFVLSSNQACNLVESSAPLPPSLSIGFPGRQLSTVEENGRKDHQTGARNLRLTRGRGPLLQSTSPSGLERFEKGTGASSVDPSQEESSRSPGVKRVRDGVPQEEDLTSLMGTAGSRSRDVNRDLICRYCMLPLSAGPQVPDEVFQASQRQFCRRHRRRAAPRKRNYVFEEDKNKVAGSHCRKGPAQPSTSLGGTPAVQMNHVRATGAVANEEEGDLAVMSDTSEVGPEAFRIGVSEGNSRWLLISSAIPSRAPRTWAVRPEGQSGKWKQSPSFGLRSAQPRGDRCLPRLREGLDCAAAASGREGTGRDLQTSGGVPEGRVHSATTGSNRQRFSGSDPAKPWGPLADPASPSPASCFAGTAEEPRSVSSSAGCVWLPSFSTLSALPVARGALTTLFSAGVNGAVTDGEADARILHTPRFRRTSKRSFEEPSGMSAGTPAVSPRTLLQCKRDAKRVAGSTSKEGAEAWPQDPERAQDYRGGISTGNPVISWHEEQDVLCCALCRCRGIIVKSSSSPTSVSVSGRESVTSPFWWFEYIRCADTRFVRLPSNLAKTPARAASFSACRRAVGHSGAASESLYGWRHAEEREGLASSEGQAGPPFGSAGPLQSLSFHSGQKNAFLSRQLSCTFADPYRGPASPLSPVMLPPASLPLGADADPSAQRHVGLSGSIEGRSEFVEPSAPRLSPNSLGLPHELVGEATDQSTRRTSLQSAELASRAEALWHLFAMNEMRLLLDFADLCCGSPVSLSSTWPAGVAEYSANDIPEGEEISSLDTVRCPRCGKALDKIQGSGFEGKWRCDGLDSNGFCVAGLTEYRLWSDATRHRCHSDDFDYCQACFEYKSKLNARKRRWLKQQSSKLLWPCSTSAQPRGPFLWHVGSRPAPPPHDFASAMTAILAARRKNDSRKEEVEISGTSGGSTEGAAPSSFPTTSQGRELARVQEARTEAGNSTRVSFASDRESISALARTSRGPEPAREREELLSRYAPAPATCSALSTPSFGSLLPAVQSPYACMERWIRESTATQNLRDSQAGGETSASSRSAKGAEVVRPNGVMLLVPSQLPYLPPPRCNPVVLSGLPISAFTLTETFAPGLTRLGCKFLLPLFFRHFETLRIHGTRRKPPQPSAELVADAINPVGQKRQRGCSGQQDQTPEQHGAAGRLLSDLLAGEEEGAGDAALHVQASGGPNDSEQSAADSRTGVGGGGSGREAVRATGAALLSGNSKVGVQGEEKGDHPAHLTIVLVAEEMSWPLVIQGRFGGQSGNCKDIPHLKGDISDHTHCEADGVLLSCYHNMRWSGAARREETLRKRGGGSHRRQGDYLCGPFNQQVQDSDEDGRWFVDVHKAQRDPQHYKGTIGYNGSVGYWNLDTDVPGRSAPAFVAVSGHTHTPPVSDKAVLYVSELQNHLELFLPADEKELEEHMKYLSSAANRERLRAEEGNAADEDAVGAPAVEYSQCRGSQAVALPPEPDQQAGREARGRSCLLCRSCAASGLPLQASDSEGAGSYARRRTASKPRKQEQYFPHPSGAVCHSLLDNRTEKQRHEDEIALQTWLALSDPLTACLLSPDAAQRQQMSAAVRCYQWESALQAQNSLCQLWLLHPETALDMWPCVLRFIYDAVRARPSMHRVLVELLLVVVKAAAVAGGKGRRSEKLRRKSTYRPTASRARKCGRSDGNAWEEDLEETDTEHGVDESCEDTTTDEEDASSPVPREQDTVSWSRSLHATAPVPPPCLLPDSLKATFSKSIVEHVGSMALLHLAAIGLLDRHTTEQADAYRVYRACRQQQLAHAILSSGGGGSGCLPAAVQNQEAAGEPSSCPFISLGFPNNSAEEAAEQAARDRVSICDLLKRRDDDTNKLVQPEAEECRGERDAPWGVIGEGGALSMFPDCSVFAGIAYGVQRPWSPSTSRDLFGFSEAPSATNTPMPHEEDGGDDAILRDGDTIGESVGGNDGSRSGLAGTQMVSGMESSSEQSGRQSITGLECLQDGRDADAGCAHVVNPGVDLSIHPRAPVAFERFSEGMAASNEKAADGTLSHHQLRYLNPLLTVDCLRAESAHPYSPTAYVPDGTKGSCFKTVAGIEEYVLMNGFRKRRKDMTEQDDGVFPQKTGEDRGEKAWPGGPGTTACGRIQKIYSSKQHSPENAEENSGGQVEGSVLEEREGRAHASDVENEQRTSQAAWKGRTAANEKRMQDGKGEEQAEESPREMRNVFVDMAMDPGFDWARGFVVRFSRMCCTRPADALRFYAHNATDVCVAACR